MIAGSSPALIGRGRSLYPSPPLDPPMIGTEKMSPTSRITDQSHNKSHNEMSGAHGAKIKASCLLSGACGFVPCSSRSRARPPLWEIAGSSPALGDHGFVPCSGRSRVRPLLWEIMGSFLALGDRGFVPCSGRSWVRSSFWEIAGSSPALRDRGFAPCSGRSRFRPLARKLRVRHLRTVSDLVDCVFGM